MSRYVPLSRKHHQYSGVAPAGHAHALQQSLVPLALEELPQALAHMVTAFVPTEGGGYQLVGLQSLVEGNNVYLDARGSWTVGYQPAWYRAHPFRIVASTGGAHFVIYVDEASPAFRLRGGDGTLALFDSDGEYSEGGQRIVNFLKQLHQASLLTSKVLDQLDQAGLIVPWIPRWSTEATAPGQSLQQLFHIDEQKLRVLSSEQLAGLVRSGALSVAYAQLFSEHRLRHLVELCETRWGQIAPAAPASVEDLFGGDDDVLRFDF